MAVKLEIKLFPAILSSETSKNGAFGLTNTIVLSNFECYGFGGNVIVDKVLKVMFDGLPYKLTSKRQNYFSKMNFISGID